MQRGNEMLSRSYEMLPREHEIKQNFFCMSLRGLRKEEICWRAFWRWEMLESKLSVICVKMVVEEKGRDQSVERGSVHDEE